jgi:hypothetical protein
MGKAYKVQDIPFETEQVPIDSFSVPDVVLENDGYRVVHQQYELLQDNIEGNPTIGNYLTKDVLKNLADYPEKTTVIIDVQVGKGKTQSCYDLIEDYSKDDDTVVLMLSPFRKLVEKDNRALKDQRGLSVFCYKELDVDGEIPIETVDSALEKKVHIMTINCLLGNPGEGAFAQKWIKSCYLSRLFDKCVAENKKVVMFFDEIHESIANFLPKFIPNLFKWWQVVHTCFVSSATYTAAVFPVFKYIGALTNHNFTVLSLRRHKWKQDCISSLHLHIVTEEYSASNLTPLSHLGTLLENNKGKQINILTGHRSLAIALQKPFDPNGNANPFHEILAPFNFNVITGSDKDKEFDPNTNNIGTAFKTGVSITNPDSLMIIILPVIRDNNSESIFSDGVPSLIQCLARQRKGGDIHVFMYRPEALIDFDSEMRQWIDKVRTEDEVAPITTLYKPISNRLPADFVARMRAIEFRGQFTSLDELWRQYSRRYGNNRVEIEMLNSLEKAGITQLGFQYPTFEQYLLEEGGKLAAKNFHSYGGDLSSYMLWAALNSQFVNAELTTISYHAEDVKEVAFDSLDFKKSLLRHLTTEVIESLKIANLQQAKRMITEAIKQPNSSSVDYQYTVDGNVLPFNYLVTDYRFLRSVLEIVAANNGITVSTSELKAQYMLHSITSCILRDDATARPVELAYKRLYEVQIDFLDYCKSVIKQASSGYAIHKDADKGMPMALADKVKDIAATLQAEDPFIKSKAISVLQNVDKATGETLRSKVFNELSKIFTNLSDARVSIGKETKQYYRIDGQLDKPLPNQPVLNGI